MRVTIKQIASELGISHSTVSRVLNEKQSHLISEATRDRIVATAARMGYRPSRIAQALQGKKTQLIGVFLPDADDFFFHRVVKNLRHLVEQDQYELIVFVSSPEQISANWYRLLQWDLDGIFVFDYMFFMEGLWEALTQHTGNIPAIVGLFSNKTQLQDYVTIDFQPALEELMSHFLRQGCRKVGYLGPPGSLSPGEQRYAVFSDFARKHDIEQSDFALPTEETLMEAARRCLREALEAGRPLPEALFCQNDEIALGAYRALREAGIAVPAQVALAGCDDIPYVSYLETPLTTISLPVEEVCRRGWRILQDRMAQPEGPPFQAILTPALHIRASSQKREGQTAT